MHHRCDRTPTGGKQFLKDNSHKIRLFPQYLSKKYMARYLESSELENFVQFDSFDEYKDHWDNYESWNYGDEYYIEALVKMDRFHKL